MQFSFAGKVALITGASSGLGEAYARYLAEHGARVIVHGRSERTEEVAHAVEASGGEVIAVRGDLAIGVEAERVMHDALKRWGRVDVLINNAGNEPESFEARVEELTEQALERALRVHLHAAFRLSTGLWSGMAERGYGRIVNVSSGHVFGSYSDFGLVPYSIAKAGVIGLTRSLALAGRPSGIRVNCVMPAALDTASNRGQWEFTREELDQLRVIAPACKVAPLVAWLAHADVPCNGEMFSVCNENVTRVFLADSKGYDYTQFDSVDACIRAAMTSKEFKIPASIGEFFGSHLGVSATEKLFAILQGKRRQTGSSQV